MPGIHKSPTSTTNKSDKQMIRFQKLILPILAGLLSACGQPQCVITPRPEHFERKCGYFLCDSARVAEGEIPGLIRTIDTAAEGLRAEGYRLLVTRKGISLTARDSAGLFYGEQSLRQLASAKGIPCVEITDNPRFAYRGMHLDVSRHFFPKEQVFKILDEMARYKLNKFHFHLTDNGGWRIQIDKYPLLTRLGSHRMEIDWLKWWDFGDKHYVPEGTPGAYGGYFTKEEIRQIVAYAAERHIEVIPEIEFPAHSDEVFVGYPELCCTGKPYTTGEFCVGNPATLQFAKDVLTEIMELFPEYLPNTYLNYYLQQKEFVEHSNPKRTRANEVEETREKNLFDGIDRYEKTGEIDESVFYAGSHGDWIADLAIALKNDTKARFLIITENRGALPNMPYDAMVEVPAYIGKKGPEVICQDPIPLFQQGLMMQQLNSEKLLVQGAIEGSYEKVLQAFTLNKTVPSMTVAKEILDDMIEANKGYWPELH